MGPIYMFIKNITTVNSSKAKKEHTAQCLWAKFKRYWCG